MLIMYVHNGYGVEGDGMSYQEAAPTYREQGKKSWPGMAPVLLTCRRFCANAVGYGLTTGDLLDAK